MIHTALLTTDSKTENMILIVDKQGLIGKKIAQKINKEAEVVLGSEFSNNIPEQILYVQIKKNFSKIPSGKYSHIIVVDEKCNYGKKELNALLKKSKNEKTSMLLLVGKQYLTQKKYLDYSALKQNISLAIFGDVFSAENQTGLNNPIEKILLGINKEWKISIPGDGTDEVFPVFIDDLVSSILEVCFSDFKEKVFFIYPKNKITFLTFAAAFKKIHPEIRLDFVQDKNMQRHKNSFLSGRYMLGEGYNLIEKIKLINLNSVASYEKTITHNKKSNKSSIILTTLFLLVLIILPLISIPFFNFTNRILVDTSAKELRKNNLKNVIFLTGIGSSAYQLYYLSSSFTKIGLERFGEKIFLEKLENTALENKVKIKIYGEIASYLTTLSKIINNGFSEDDNEVLAAKRSFLSAFYNYNLAKNIIDQTKWTEEITSLFEVINNVDYLSEILAKSSNREYLLVQKITTSSPFKQEIIDWVGLLEVKNGKLSLKDLQMQSISATESADTLKKINSLNLSGTIFFSRKFAENFKKTINKDSDKNQIPVSLEMFNVIDKGLKESQLKITFSNPQEQTVFLK